MGGDKALMEGDKAVMGDLPTLPTRENLVRCGYMIDEHGKAITFLSLGKKGLYCAEVVKGEEVSKYNIRNSH